MSKHILIIGKNGTGRALQSILDRKYGHKVAYCWNVSEMAETAKDHEFRAGKPFEVVFVKTGLKNMQKEEMAELKAKYPSIEIFFEDEFTVAEFVEKLKYMERKEQFMKEMAKMDVLLVGNNYQYREFLKMFLKKMGFLVGTRKEDSIDTGPFDLVIIFGYGPEFSEEIEKKIRAKNPEVKLAIVLDGKSPESAYPSGKGIVALSKPSEEDLKNAIESLFLSLV